MAMGPVNISGGSGSGSSDGVPLDSENTVVFALGCDSVGVYIVTPDEDEGGGTE